MIIMQCAVLFGFLALGEFIVWATGIPIPSSIIGMLLLTAALHFKLVKIHQVDKISDFLVKNLGFFFVPAGVALMCHLELIKAQLIPIVAASGVSTIIVITVTGQFHQLTRKIFSRHAVSRK